MIRAYVWSPPWAGSPATLREELRIISASYRIHAYDPHTLTLEVERPAAVAPLDLVELRRMNIATGAYERELICYVEEIEEMRRTLRIIALSLRGVLGWRRHLYYAGQSGKSIFGNVTTETLAKTLINMNFGPQATTANGRLRDGSVTWMEIEANQSRGPLVASRGVAWREVWAECAAIARLGRARIGVGLTAGGWLRVTYLEDPILPQPVHRFDERMGNVESWALVRAAHQASAVAAGGEGEGTARSVVVVESPDAPARERFKHAAWSGVQLEDEARDELRERGARREIRLSVAQTEGSRYWRDYRVAQYVGVSVPGYEALHRIVAVSVHAEGGQERIEVETEEVRDE